MNVGKALLSQVKELRLRGHGDSFPKSPSCNLENSPQGAALGEGDYG